MSTTYKLHVNAARVFDKAASLLFQAETGLLGDVKIADYIQLAYDAAVVFCPQLLDSPMPSEHPFQKRRVVGLASQLWLDYQAKECAA